MTNGKIRIDIRPIITDKMVGQDGAAIKNMNQLSTYEQMIAEEIEGIEIPDMADAILGRIEPVLDVELPVNDTPAALTDKPFFKKPAVWMISACIIAIVIALFLLSRNRKTAPPPPPQKDLPQQTAPTIKPDTIMQQHFKPPDTRKPVPGKNTSTIREKHVVDTVAHSAFINERSDSLLKVSPDIKMPPAIKIPSPDRMTPLDIKQRPKYGVEVSDSDYRFNVKPKG